MVGYMKEIAPSQFDSEVVHSEVPVLVDFYTQSCGPCRTMSPILAEMEIESSGTLKIVKIDAAADGPFSASFRVNAVPTFLLFNRGQQVGHLIGARGKKELAKWVKDSIGATS